MKKFINNPDTLVHDSLVGFADAHASMVRVQLAPLCVMRAKPKKQGVALVSGGGSGHEPLHIGMVGVGMLDAACPGQIFTSPTPDQLIAAAKQTHTGAGVLFIVKNYSGDTMNFQMASEMLDIEHLTVLVNDDVAVENSTHTTGRRGVAGTLIVEKVVGAAAEAGASLRECKAIGDRANRNTASMGVAFNSCIVPTAGVPTFDIDADEMEIGVGIHGEPGRRRDKFKAASLIVDELLQAIVNDLRPKRGQQALLHINGLGATPLMELYLLHHLASKQLNERGVRISRSLVGNYTTSLDMAGASITLALLDEELTSLWDAPVRTPSLHW
jgi:phosphoenolpyruvate---glycerone phosphotransferase subunit DhaK